MPILFPGKSKPNKPCVIDLFCGAGGLSLGAARAGFDVRGAVDTDPHALSVHSLNFPHTPHLSTDIASITWSSLKSALELRNNQRLGIIGGPPCQGFSYIGKNQIDDLRNSLFVDFFRIVAEASPVFFLAENVPGILHSRAKPIRDRAMDYVKGKYEILPPFSLSANRLGAPTTRTRVFFIGYLAEEMDSVSQNVFQRGGFEDVRVGDALRGLPSRIGSDWQNETQSWRSVREYGSGPFMERLYSQVPKTVGDQRSLELLRKRTKVSGFLGTRHSRAVVARFDSVRQGESDPISRAPRLDPDGYCPTLRAGTGSDHGSYQAVRPIHPTVPRVITPREAARLQGFPDWFQFSPTKWHSFRQIGSSVCPILAEKVMRVLHRAMNDTPGGEFDGQDSPK